MKNFTRTIPHKHFEETSFKEISRLLTERGLDINKQSEFSFDIIADLVNSYSHEIFGQDRRESFINLDRLLEEEEIDSKEYKYHSSVQEMLTKIDFDTATGSTPIDKAINTYFIIKDVADKTNSKQPNKNDSDEDKQEQLEELIKKLQEELDKKEPKDKDKGEDKDKEESEDKGEDKESVEEGESDESEDSDGNEGDGEGQDGEGQEGDEDEGEEGSGDSKESKKRKEKGKGKGKNKGEGEEEGEETEEESDEDSNESEGGESEKDNKVKDKDKEKKRSNKDKEGKTGRKETGNDSYDVNKSFKDLEDTTSKLTEDDKRDLAQANNLKRLKDKLELLQEKGLNFNEEQIDYKHNLPVEKVQQALQGYVDMAEVMVSDSSVENLLLRNHSIDLEQNYIQMSVDQKRLFDKLAVLRDRGKIKAVKVKAERKISRMEEYSQLPQLANMSSKLLPTFNYKFATKQLLVKQDKQATKQNLLLLIDDSGSMSYSAKMQWVEALVYNRLDAVLQNNARLMIAWFEGKIHRYTIIENRQQAKEFILNKKSFGSFNGGGTNIERALKEGLNLIKTKFNSDHTNSQILIINDGQDEIDPNFKPGITTSVFILGTDNYELKKVCINSGGMYEKFL